MEVNRLDEIKRQGKDGKEVEMEATKSKESEGMVEHMKQYEPIKEGLNHIRHNVSLIEKLKDQERTTVNEPARRDIMEELDRIMNETTNEGSNIKKKLDLIKAENDKFKAKRENANSATMQMRINLYQTHIRRFHQVMNTYQQASLDFKKALKDRSRRQLAYIDKTITPEQIDKIVDSGHAEEIIGEALISEELDNVVRDIEERHQGILKLEQQVKEVYELFRDLATLVDLQQETMDVIENRITMAKNYTEKAVDDLQKGEMYQKKARQRLCIILLLVLIIGGAIVIFATQLKK